jgi:hypothetical protein
MINFDLLITHVLRNLNIIKFINKLWCNMNFKMYLHISSDPLTFERFININDTNYFLKMELNRDE